MPPIVGIVGYSNSGKTFFLEKLVAEITSRGYRVATAKHVPETVHLDVEGKDSWRHLQAGSAATVIASAEGMAMLKPVTDGASLEKVAAFIGENYDIVLVEGFKQADIPKIEVHRQKIAPVLEGLTRLIATVTDEPLAREGRQFSFEEAARVADLLEAGFIRPGQERINVRVNGEPLSLTAFPRQIIQATILAMFATLKGAKQIDSLEIFIRRNENSQTSADEPK